MSSTLRDLVVNIDFEGLDVRQLVKIDSAVDEIEDSFRDMGQEINQVTGSAATMGAVTDNALEEIQREAFIAALAVNGLGNNFTTTTLKAGGLSAAMLGASSAIIAASAPLLAATGALAASFTAAGIGAAGFGAVAVGALGQIFEASGEVKKLEENIANADTAEERIMAQKELAAAYLKMSDEQRGALKSLKDFKSFWTDFVKEFENPVFEAFGNTLDGTRKLLKKLEPTIQSVAGVVVGLTERFNEALDTAGSTRFFEWLETNAARSIESWAETLGNFTSGFLELLQAFDPITKDVENGFVGMSEKFKTWASNLENNQSFQNFLDYAKENTPILIDAFKEIVELGSNIIEELAPIGTTVLDGFKDLTGFINDNWGPLKETIIGVSAAVGTFAGLMKGLQIIGVINTLFTAWRAGTLAQTVAMWGLNTAMLANPLTWIVVGIAAVIGIGVALYRNWDTVKEKAGQLWGWLKEKFGAIKDATLKFIQPVVDMFGSLMDKWENLKSSLSNFKMPKIGMPKWLGGDGLIQPDGSHADGLAEVKRNGYTAELHKGESVLTARQANALRGAGVLGNKGDRPTIEMGKNMAPTRKETKISNNFNPSFEININGASDNARDIADQAREATRDELERFWMKMNLKQA